jgi:branched-chain amino acid transport system ATP-binding protein
MTVGIDSGLDVAGLRVDRLGQPVVIDVDVRVPAGEITVVLGANGAGKSTLLDGISGVTPVRDGTIRLDGADLSRSTRRRRAQSGVAYVQQGRTIFAGLTVEENLLVVAPKSEFELAFDLFPELSTRVGIRASLLSGGEQQMLVLARAVLQRPRVLLIDELSLGLAPIVVERMLAAVGILAQSGMGILLVEQFADRALAIGSTALVLSRGRVALAGNAAEIRSCPDRLRAAYLGVDIEFDSVD